MRQFSIYWLRCMQPEVNNNWTVESEYYNWFVVLLHRDNLRARCKPQSVYIATIVALSHTMCTTKPFTAFSCIVYTWRGKKKSILKLGQLISDLLGKINFTLVQVIYENLPIVESVKSSHKLPLVCLCKIIQCTTCGFLLSFGEHQDLTLHVDSKVVVE